MTFKKLALSAAISSALMLTGCWDDDSSDNDESTSYSLAGAASKGIIQNGLVTAYELVDGEWVSRGTDTTDENGDYSITLSGYTDGVVKLEITATTATTMIDDDPTSVTYGDSVDADSDLSMSSVISAAESGTVSDIPITPYTNMAAAEIEASDLTAVTAGGVDSANSEVSTLVGFDVIDTAVVDVTDAEAMADASTSEQQAAVLAAAVNALVDDTDTDLDTLSEVVDALAESFEDGSFESNDDITITELTTAWEETAADEDITEVVADSVITTVEVAVDAIDEATTGGEYDPEASDNAGDTDVETAKDLISDMSSLISNITTAADDYSSPLDLIDEDATAVADIFDADMAVIGEFVGLGLDAMISELTGSSEDSLQDELTTNGTVTETVTVYDDDTELGDLTLTVTSSGGLQAVLSGTLTGEGDDANSVLFDNLTISSNLSLDELLDLDDEDSDADGTLDQTTFTFELSGGVSSGDSSIAFTDGTLTAVTSEAITDQTEPSLTSLSLDDLTVDLTSDGGSFTGSAAIDFVAVDSTVVSEPLYDLSLTFSSVDLSGTFKLDSGASYVAKIGLDLTNASTFDVAAFLDQESYADIWIDSVLNDTQIASIETLLTNEIGTSTDWAIGYECSDSACTEMWSWIHTDDDGSSITDYETSLTEIFNPYNYITVAMAGIDVEVYSAQLYLDSDGWNDVGAWLYLGSFDESDDNFMQVEFSLTTTLTGITDMPEVAISASVDRDSLNGGSAVLQLNWDNEQYTIDLDVVDADEGDATLTITNPGGVSLELTNVTEDDDYNVSGYLYVGETQVGEIETLDSGAVKVSYIDNTFEIL